ncbi:MAG: rhomboid family intramembrane serine protease [Verrucomicrobiota bacterium]
MSGYRDWTPSSEEHRPLTYWGGHPIYAAHMVVIVYCVLMIVTAIAGAHLESVLNWLLFTSHDVHRGQIWRIFTYGLFNAPSLGFAVDMLMLVWFGRELERTIGRRLFGYLYGGIYLIPPVVLTLVGFLTPTVRIGQPGALALFVAFATYFPGMPVFFMLLAKWAAMILVGIFTLIHLAARDWVSLALLWSSCGYAHLFVRYQQGTFSLPRINLFRRRPKFRVLPDLPPEQKIVRSAPVASAPPPDATMAEVDALLDKIAKSGINSLTARERAKLEAARVGLLKRGPNRD